MSMKKTDLVKQLASKLDGRMKHGGVPGRFAEGSADVVDRREQRRRDAAAGLVAFACKLPAELVKRLNERAASHEGGVNAWLAAAIEGALEKADGKGSNKAGDKASDKQPDPVPAGDKSRRKAAS